MAGYSLNGKVAVVTGAARGIGFETARQLHERGAYVVLTDLDEEAVTRAAKSVGERGLGIPADVTDLEAMEGVVSKSVEHFGGLDVVVANAGVAPPGATMRNIDPDAFERTVEVDLLGVWRSVRPALPQIVERGGHVVVVSSVYAWLNGIIVGPYAVSKAGVEAMGRALRAELSVHGASASVAHFGFIDTEMVRQGFTDPIAHRFEETFPKFARKRLSPAQAGAAIVTGIERRAPRIVVPGWWRAWFALRGVLNPIFDRQLETRDQYQAILRDADARTSQTGTEDMTRPASAADAATAAGAGSVTPPT